MIVNDRFKFVFVHIPKTAGTSVRTALRALEGNTEIGVGPTKHETPKEFLDSYQERTGLTTDKIIQHRFICFVRNPIDRFSSLHRYLVKTHRHVYPDVPLSLNAFVDAVVEEKPWTQSIRAIRPQTAYTEGVSPWIGRFETLDDDFQLLATLLETPMQLEHLNDSQTAPKVSVSSLLPWKLLGRIKRVRRSARYVPEALSPTSLKSLETYYATDFEHFGY